MNDQVRQRYLDLNGNHPMTEVDDDYVRDLFVEVPDDDPTWPREEIHQLMVSGELPLPSYLLSDGEPMVHPGYLDLLQSTGTPCALGLRTSPDQAGASARSRPRVIAMPHRAANTNMKIE